MKIETSNKNALRLKNIEVGDAFMYRDCVHMKCDGANTLNCVNLETGITYILDSHTLIKSVQAKVVIK